MIVDLSCDQRLGRYQVVSHLATGGMGQLLLARQTGANAVARLFVLKTIRHKHSRDDRFMSMFLDEATIAATLHHQNIAQIYGLEQVGDTYFMVMEHVEGENLGAVIQQTLRRGWNVPLELALAIVGGVAAGLDHAHGRRDKHGQSLRIVHRDVSPGNIVIGFDGSVKLLDFGIAIAEGRTTTTATGSIKGKSGYMSPEQCAGMPLDHRTDIFALGVCLYELTTLRRAFDGVDPFERMKRITRGDVIPPSMVVPEYPAELEAIVMTALAPNRAERYQTANDLIDALDAFAAHAELTGSNLALSRFMRGLFGGENELVAADGVERSRPAADLEVSFDVSTAPLDDVAVPAPQLEDDDDDRTTRFVGAAAPAKRPNRSALHAWLPACTAVALGMAIPTVEHRIGSAVADEDPSGAANARPGARGTSEANPPRASAVNGNPTSATEAGPGVGVAHARPSRAVDVPESPATPKRAALPVKTVELRVSTTPADATVLLDGRRLGRTPYAGTVTAAPGTHVVKIRRRGRATTTLDIELTHDIRLDVVLRRNTAELPARDMLGEKSTPARFPTAAQIAE